MRLLYEPALLYNTPFPTPNRCIKQAEGRNGNVNRAKWDADLEHRNNLQLDEFRNLNLRSVLKLPPPPSSTQTHTGAHAHTHTHTHKHTHTHTHTGTNREIFRQAQPIDSSIYSIKRSITQSREHWRSEWGNTIIALQSQVFQNGWRGTVRTCDQYTGESA